MRTTLARTSPHDASEASAEGHLFKQHFGAAEYIQTYYPSAFNVDDVYHVLTLVHAHFARRKSLSVRTFAARYHVSDELIENVAIFDFQRVLVRLLAAQFPKGNATVLDVGGGPTIYQHIALSIWARSITHAEFLERNRESVHAWVQGMNGAHDWDGYISLVQRMLRNDTKVRSALRKNPQLRALLDAETPHLLREHIRSRLNGNIVACDVFKPHLLLPRRLYDVVTTNFVIESATGSRERWLYGMQNAIARVRPGGFFVHTAIRNSQWYAVGDQTLPATAVTEKDIRAVCRHHGLTIEELRVLRDSDYAHVGYDGMVFLIARRTM